MQLKHLKLHYERTTLSSMICLFIGLSKLLYITADSVSNRIHIHANVKQTAGESDEEV